MKFIGFIDLEVFSIRIVNHVNRISTEKVMLEIQRL